MLLKLQSLLNSWANRASGVNIWQRLLPGIGERSLVGRLVGVLFLGSVAVYLIVNVGLWWTSSQLIDDNLEKQAVRWLAELDELGTPLYASRDGKYVANIDKRIKNFPEVACIRYYDVTGTKVLGEYGEKRDADIPLLTAQQLETLARSTSAERNYIVDRSLLRGGYLRFITPIRIKSIKPNSLLNFSLDNEKAENVKIVGYLDLSIDSDYYKGQLISSMASGSLIIALLLMLGLFVGSRVIRRAMAPLIALQVPLGRLAQGEIDVEVERAKDAEIAVIGDALNATIRALKERDETLRKMAESDPLTGLMNRSYFARALEEEIECVTHDGSGSAVYFIDLDKFKQINDTYGHAAGDKLLIRVAEVLKSQVREKDVVSRLGGDEFTVLVRNISNADALDLADSFNKILRETYIAEGKNTFSINCSIGVAMIRPGRHTADEILSNADTACFVSKSQGRNCYHMYEDRDQSSKDIAVDTGWFRQIQQTIDKDNFVLVYQPIVGSVESGKECYEVLLRMPGPNGEQVMPSTFLPVAQRFGLMMSIDRWVITHALKALAGFRATGREIVFSINISGQSLADMSLLQLVRDEIARNQLPAGSVILEVTEQSALRNLENLKRLIRGLADTGCRFALDNFGTGFSSFAYLKNLAVDFIKIDGSFVNSMSQSSIDETMVLSIIHIARSLGMKTIAEYVPDGKTIDMLKKSGVDYMQGYFVGMPSERLPATLRVVSETKKNTG